MLAVASLCIGAGREAHAQSVFFVRLAPEVGRITGRVLDEIEASEFLIADLTHERPNVLRSRTCTRTKQGVILVRKKGTVLHFDVAHRNCPEYAPTDVSGC